MLARNGAGPAAADTANGARISEQLGRRLGDLAKPNLSSPQDTALSELARQVRDRHCQVGCAAADVLKYALACGEVLIAAKSRVPHGQWLPWLCHDCDLSERTADAYMQLARNRHVLEANPQRAANLSLRGALRLIGKKPDSALRPAIRSAPNPQKPTTTSYAPMAWWSKASIAERQRLINNIGWTELFEAIPESWHPVIQKRFGDGQPTTAALIANADEKIPNDLSIPDNLSIPAFLRRSEKQEGGAP